MFFHKKKKKKKTFGFLTADEMYEGTQSNAKIIIKDIEHELANIFRYNIHVTGYGYPNGGNMSDEVINEVINHFSKGGYLAYEENGVIIVRWDDFARSLVSSED